MKCPDCNMESKPEATKCEWCGASLMGVEPEVVDDSSGDFDDVMEPPLVDVEIPFEAEPETVRTMQKVPIAVGIDLGTTNSVVAVYRNDRPETLAVEGSKLVPSVVSFRDKDTILVGKKAKAGMEIHPDTTVRSIKRKMGDRGYRINMHGITYTPPDISAMILKKLVDSASEAIGGKISKAVITVPAYFTSNQKEDTRKAGEKAGLEVLRLLPEPSAAAIAYGLEKAKNQTLLVYDFGGGTFDLSILRVKGLNFDVISVNGDHDLGGDDVDNKIVEFLINALQRDTKINLATDKKISVDEKRRAWQLLKEAAERAKIELSSALSTFIDMPDLVKGESLSVELTREEFENLIQGLLARTEKPILQALKDANLDAADIDRVVLVGGSTKIPMVKDIVTKILREPYTAENVDEQVAHGAAIMAASLASAEAPVEFEQEIKKTGIADIWKPPPPIEPTFVTSHSLGVGTFNPRTQKPDRFAKLINRNTKLPAKNSDMFATAEDYQTEIYCPVFQGEHEDCNYNVFLGKFELSGIEPAPAGETEIEVTFALTEDDILDVKAVDQNTGGSVNIQIDTKQSKA